MTDEEIKNDVLIADLEVAKNFLKKKGSPYGMMAVGQAIARIRATANHDKAIEALKLLVQAKDLKAEITIDSLTWIDDLNRYDKMRHEGWAKAREVLAATQSMTTPTEAACWHCGGSRVVKIVSFNEHGPNAVHSTPCPTCSTPNDEEQSG